MKKFVLIPYDEWMVLKREKSLPAKEILVQQRSQEKTPQQSTTMTMTQTPAAAAAAAAAAAPTTTTQQGKTSLKQMNPTTTTPPQKMKQTTPHQRSQHRVQWGGTETIMDGTQQPPPPTWQLRAKQFAPKYRKKADKLLYLLQKSKRLKYNAKLEIILDGKVIPHSNILQLIEHALSHKNRKRLIGLKRFYSFLMDVGIPNNLVQNDWGKSLVSKRKGPGSRN